MAVRNNRTDKPRNGSKPLFVRILELPSWFHGAGKGARTRRDVLVSIASFAHADGSDCYPGLGQIAKRANTSERTARRCFKWYEAHNRLVVKYKDSKVGTNTYEFVFPKTDSVPDTILSGYDPDNKACRPGQQDSDRDKKTADPDTILPAEEKIEDSLEEKRERAKAAPSPREEHQNLSAKVKDLFVSFAGESDNWIRKTKQLERAVYDAFQNGFTEPEIKKAITDVPVQEDDKLEFKLRAVADGLDAQLIANRHRREELARMEAAVEKQVERDRERFAREVREREERERREQQEAEEAMAFMTGIRKTDEEAGVRE